MNKTVAYVIGYAAILIVAIWALAVIPNPIAL